VWPNPIDTTIVFKLTICLFLFLNGIQQFHQFKPYLSAHLRASFSFTLVDAQNSLCAMCHLMIGWGWTELVLMGCWAQNSKPGFWACLMADGALLLICCYAGLLWREIWICCESPPFNKVTTADTFLSNQITTADSKREHHRTT
jgi:hypothetical protein